MDSTEITIFINKTKEYSQLCCEHYEGSKVREG